MGEPLAQEWGLLEFEDMGEERLVPDFKITLDGKPLSKDLAPQLHQIEVVQSVGLIDMAVLTLGNPHGIVADHPCFKHGADLVIKAGYLGQIEKVFQGDVISIEPDFPTSGTPTVIVRAYDRLHRYHRDRKQRVFLDQKVSDVISTLASEEGLSAKVEATKGPREYLLQNNQSNVELIHELARREGYEVEVDDAGKLFVGKPRIKEAKKGVLTWGETLKSFYVRSSANNVSTQVTVRYWDMLKKAKVVETNGPLEGKLEPTDAVTKVAEKAFKKANRQVSIRPCTVAGEAKALATAIYNKQALESVQARATSLGETDLTAGRIVELLGLGKMWSGLYYISGATHIFTPEGGYTTELLLRRNGTGYPVENRQIEAPSSKD